LIINIINGGQIPQLTAVRAAFGQRQRLRKTEMPKDNNRVSKRSGRDRMSLIDLFREFKMVYNQHICIPNMVIKTRPFLKCFIIMPAD
jgi:hypothetical protein